MSDKAMIIPETDILNRFDEMCAESLSPDVYSIWKDEIIPALNKIRTSLLVKVYHVALTEWDKKVIHQALKVWRGDFPETNCKSCVWQKELTALIERLELIG